MDVVGVYVLQWTAVRMYVTGCIVKTEEVALLGTQTRQFVSVHSARLAASVNIVCSLHLILTIIYYCSTVILIFKYYSNNVINIRHQCAVYNERYDD